MLTVKEEFLIHELPYPRATALLKICENVPLYHENHKQRHPYASYNVSLSSIANRTLAVIKELSELHRSRVFESPTNVNFEVPILEATDHMLDALMEHLDDCKNILESFFKDADSKDCKEILNQFKKAVHPYRDHIGKVVNFIKHNQGRLRIVVFHWPSNCAIGYYIEGPIPNVGLGPSPLIHPKSHTAFSFNYDLKFHVCCIYAISNCLAKDRARL